MPPIKNIVQLGQLIAHHHGWAAAKAFKAYALDDAGQLALSQCALALLKIYPATPAISPSANAAMMSAALAVSLERHMSAPIHVVAGSLTVDGAPLFGHRQPFNGDALFNSPTPDWNGHSWIMIGDYIVDISIFRTAYSAEGPAILARHIDLNFGPDKALYVDQWKKTRRMGLGYEPQYILSSDQVTKLMGGAYHLISQAKEQDQAS